MDTNNKNSFIYKYNGDILSEVSLGSASSSTKLVDFPKNIEENLNKSTNMQSSSKSSTFIPYGINNYAEKSETYQNDPLNKKYEYSYNDIQNIIDKQLSEKLKDFLEKAEMHQNETKSDLDNFNKRLEEKLTNISEKTVAHKEETKTELDNFKGLLDRLLGYKQNSRSNAIGITVGIGGIVIAILIGFMAPAISTYFNDTNELMTEKQIIKKDIETLNEHMKEVSNDITNLKENIENNKKQQVNKK